MTMETGSLITPNVRLSHPLGEGGMGAVWVADHLSLERQVAVKLIRGFSPSPEAKARFEREAKAAARIQSPHVVQIFDYGISDDEQPYIIMELLTGESLAERLARGPVPPEELAPILMQTGSALASAHRSGVVHRDIKPANIFLVDTPSNEAFVKVLDFGIAKIQLETTAGPAGTEVMAVSAQSAAPALTTTGAIVGTPEYMSPEQLLTTDSITPRSDIWSLGVVAYEALAGARPFSGETIIALSMAICDARYEPERVPADLRPWFERSFSVPATGRFESVMDAAETFRALARGEAAAASGTNTTSTTPVVDEPKSGLTRRTTSGLAAAAFVLGAAAVVWLSAAERTTHTPTSDSASVAQLDNSAPSSSASSAPSAPSAAPSASAAPVPPVSAAPSPPASATASASAMMLAPARPAPAPRPAPIASKCERPCREVGACGLVEDSCIPRNDADCAQSGSCREMGACAKVGYMCRAGSDADCAGSYRCKAYGECGVRGNICIAKNDADCRRSPLCTSRGRCVVEGTRCVPGSDADCRASARCASDGECTKNGMMCQR